MGYQVLVVDDSATVRAMIAKMLRLSGMDFDQIHQASNGREALELLRRHWVDLVLTDINMPEMNGVELVEELAGDELLQSIPVLVVSTEGSQKRVDALKQHGIRGYIRKPFSPEKLKRIVQDTLGTHPND